MLQAIASPNYGPDTQYQGAAVWHLAPDGSSTVSKVGYDGTAEAVNDSGIAVGQMIWTLSGHLLRQRAVLILMAAPMQRCSCPGKGEVQLPQLEPGSAGGEASSINNAGNIVGTSQLKDLTLAR